MWFDKLNNKDILIAGYGKEGQSTHCLLNSLSLNSKIDVAHNNEEIANALKNNHYDYVIKSPGIPTSFFDNLCNPSVITSQTDIFLSAFGEHVIGISGTKGKSTTTSMIYKVLNDNYDGSVFLAGNIGIPLFDLIPQMEEASDNALIVAELSCHQLENIHCAPKIGVLLNLYEEHLDHYRNYNDYCMAKLQMGLKQKLGDTLYYCSDNSDLKRMVENHRPDFRGELVPYCMDDVKHNQFVANTKWPLCGDHNLSNIYVSWMICKQLGIDSKQFEKSVLNFKPLEHRLEFVGEADGVEFYNDSISTIPQATIAAVDALKKVDTLVLGGFNRGIDYQPLAHYLVENPLGRNIKSLILLGSAGKSIKEAIDSLSPNIERHSFIDFSDNYCLEDAINQILPHIERGKICLLSPAASSYDCYINFEERGRDFKRIVSNIKNNIQR